MNKLLVGLGVVVVVGALLVAGLAVSRPVKVDVSGVLGNSTLRDFPTVFNQGLSLTGEFDADGAMPYRALGNATTTDSLTASQLCSNTGIRYGFASDTLTGVVTLPSSADLKAGGTCLNTLGAVKNFVVVNASSSGTFRFANNTSSTLVSQFLASSTIAGPGFGTSTIPNNGVGLLKGMRVASSSAFGASERVIWTLDIYGN